MVKTNNKFASLFAACKSTERKQKKDKKQKQKGGSYASDSVNGQLDAGAFENISFMLSSGSGQNDGIIGSSSSSSSSGGGCGCSGSKRGGNPPIVVAGPSLDAPSFYNASMMTSMAQPLTPNISFNDVQQFPSYMNNFSPSLTNSW